MDSDKKFIAMGIAVFLIAAAISYIVLKYTFDFTKNEEDSNNNLVLLQQEVRRELKEFRMIKRIKHRDLILRKENFTQISNYQKYVTPNDPTLQSYITSNAISTAQQAYVSAVNWI